MMWRLSVFGLVFGAIVVVPAWSRAQDSSSESRWWRGDVVEVEETNFCANEGGGIDSVNYAYWEDIYVPCFARYDYCKTDFVLNVGDARVGRNSTTYYSEPDAYFQASQCGWASPIGRTDGALYVFVNNAIGIDFNCSSSLQVALDFYVEQHNSADCSGNAEETWADMQDCWVMCLNDSGYHHMAAAGIGDCDADEGGEPGYDDSCHMPDVYIDDLVSGRTYKYYIQTWIYVGGSWQHGGQQTGCFKATTS